jgi:ribosomal protein S18 acetylase RimI-like enzyme
MQIRPFTRNDVGQLVELLNDDRLIGQPEVTEAAVLNTLAKKSLVDQSFYDELVNTQILVATEGSTLRGAVAYGDTDAGGRDILWLEGRENRKVIDALLVTAFDGWDGPARAFWYASPVGAGLEGLPSGHRPVIADALRACGFKGSDQWSYQHCVLDGTSGNATLWQSTNKTVYDGDCAVGEYEIGFVAPHTGVLWWIEIQEAYRGRGLGGQALDAALADLSRLGANEVIGYVDDDPASGRSRVAAKALYASRGFHEVDRLWSFEHL